MADQSKTHQEPRTENQKFLDGYRQHTYDDLLRLGRLAAYFVLSVLSFYVYLDYFVMQLPHQIPLRIVPMSLLLVFLFSSFTGLKEKRPSWLICVYYSALFFLMFMGYAMAILGWDTERFYLYPAIILFVTITVFLGMRGPVYILAGLYIIPSFLFVGHVLWKIPEIRKLEAFSMNGAAIICFIVLYFFNERLRRHSYHTEQQLRKRNLDLILSEESKRILLDNIQIQVWYLTDDHTYGAVNEAHAAFNGARKEHLAFKNIYDILPGDVVEVYREANREVFTTGKPVHSEELLPHASGKQRLISILKSPKLRDDGTVEYVVCSAEDITERKTAEERLRKMAETDELTGLWNRRYFLNALEREMERARRYEQVFSLLMLDIDNFKRINDTHGHSGGDLCLRHFASILRESLRQVDVPSRLGGEEFAVILPQTDLAGGYAIAERFRMSIGKRPASVGETSVSFSVSIGAASYRPDISGPDEILKMADKALYQAKSEGRNKTVKYENS